VLNLLLVVALVVVGWAAHSVGVLAEGVDYLADAAGIGVSLLALHLSHRATTARRPDGFPRAGAFAALVNAGWLLILTVLVVAGAADRLITGTGPVHGLPVLFVSAIAAAVMVVGALILRADDGDPAARDGGGDLSMRAVLLDTAGDAAAAGGVAVSGAVIFVTGGLDWLDPAVALVIAVVVGYQAVRLLREVREELTRPAPRS